MSQALQQNTPEWLEMRRSHIGASDAPIIMGLSPWKTPLQLWEEKVNGKESFKSEAMQRGHDLEDDARACFESMTGSIVMPKVMFHDTRGWQMASLDGITFDGSTIVEIKCPNKETHEMARKGGIPDHYMAQIQHQFSVSGATKGYYFTYNGKEGLIVEVVPDEKFIKKMIKEEEKFLACMRSGIPSEDWKVPYEPRDDLEWYSAAKEYKEIKLALDVMTSGLAAAKDRLMELAGEKNCEGHGIRLRKSIVEGAVDYKLVPELIGVDLQPYRKPSFTKCSVVVKEEL